MPGAGPVRLEISPTVIVSAVTPGAFEGAVQGNGPEAPLAASLAVEAAPPPPDVPAPVDPVPPEAAFDAVVPDPATPLVEPAAAFAVPAIASRRSTIVCCAWVHRAPQPAAVRSAKATSTAVAARRG